MEQIGFIIGGSILVGMGVGILIGSLGILRTTHCYYLKIGGQRKGFIDFMRHSNGEWDLVLLNSQVRRK